MKLVKKEIKNSEIVHYVNDDLLITSLGNTVKISNAGNETIIRLPVARWQSAMQKLRLLRRLFRLDKMNVVLVDNSSLHLVIIHQGSIYSYKKDGALTLLFRVDHGRNVLHNSIAVIPGDCLIFGEYFGNNSQAPVNIYRIDIPSMEWRRIYTFESGSIRHVHSCYWDKYTGRIWVFTGDYNGECQVLVADPEFYSVERLGDGSQTWRAVSAFFTEEYVYWIMDSPIDTSHLVRLNRTAREITVLTPFPGPVYYSADLGSDGYLVATTCEPGPSVVDNSAHIFLSPDLENWNEVCAYEHDGLPMAYFKYAIIGFSAGVQSLNKFYIFCEAIKGQDGKSFQCQITE
jgi:hypothetical protein